MSLESIKKQIVETKTVAERTVPEDSRSKAGLESAKNQATQKLEELKTLYRDEIRKNTTLYLVYGPNVVYNVATPPNVYVMNHKDLAYKLSGGVVNSLRGNAGLSAFHITPLNEYLRETCKDLGLSTEHLPDLGMQQQFTHAIQSREHLVDTIEAMLEYYMKSNEEEKEGHAIQSVYIADKYLTAVENSPASSDLKLFVFVPSMSKEIKASYGRFLTDNIKTISFDNKVHAEQYFTTGEQLQEFVTNLGVETTIVEEKTVEIKSVEKTIRKKKVQ